MSVLHKSFDAKPLLAKSLPSGGGALPWAVTLEGHLSQTREVAREVCRLGGALTLTNLGLEPSVWGGRLEQALTMAALMHDLGKANSRFQGMVYGIDVGRQAVRHEALSAWLVLHPRMLRPHLLPSGELGDAPELVCAVLAVLGHHVKYCVRGPAMLPGISSPSASGVTRLLLDHPDFLKCLNLLGISGFSHAPLELTAEQILEGDDDLDGLYDLVEEFNEVLLDQMGYDGFDPNAALGSEWGRFLAAVRALLVSCDVVASAAPSRGLDPARWLGEVFPRRPSVEELGAVVAKRLGGQGLRPFQAAVGNSASRVTVVTAGCGSGKTVAAYQWAMQQAPGRRLFVCYPTTGTATEGFGDYIMDADLPGALVHGRALVDLERLHLNRDRDDEDDAEEAARLHGLELLSAPVVVCTVDTVLGMMRHHRRGLWGSAAITEAAFVFDEVHAYDRTMWETLLAFLDFLPGARVLLMTATLPTSRRAELEQRLGAGVGFIDGPPELENLGRYRLRPNVARGEALEAAVTMAQAGGKVLMVCNTVTRALNAATQLREAVAGGGPNAPEVFVYHSRFRYEDRVNRHRDLVDRFQKAGDGRGVIGVTTQVAEMSLDLDADLLVTEMAPVASLIQRLGRLNRKAKPGSCEPREALLIALDPVKEGLPYRQQDYTDAEQWLVALAGRGQVLSQRDLAQCFDAILAASDEMTPIEPVELVSTPIEACRGALRESGVTGNFLLKSDALGVTLDRSRILGAVIPMILPRWWSFTSWPRVGMAYVVPDDLMTYDPLLGASWNRKEG